jgi:hypothetical protein
MMRATSAVHEVPMGNWFSRLFKSDPEEAKNKVFRELGEKIIKADERGDNEVVLQLAGEMLASYPEKAFGWTFKINALMRLGRHLEAAAVKMQAQEKGIDISKPAW